MRLEVVDSNLHLALRTFVTLGAFVRVRIITIVLTLLALASFLLLNALMLIIGTEIAPEFSFLIFNTILIAVYVVDDLLYHHLSVHSSLVLLFSLLLFIFQRPISLNDLVAFLSIILGLLFVVLSRIVFNRRKHLHESALSLRKLKVFLLIEAWVLLLAFINVRHLNLDAHVWVMEHILIDHAHTQLEDVGLSDGFITAIILVCNQLSLLLLFVLIHRRSFLIFLLLF